MAGRAADERAKSHHDLLDAEGFHHIVVRAGLEPLDLLRPAVARSQDEDRQIAARGAPVAQDGQPVALGEPEIEHRRVVEFGGAEMAAILAIARDVDREMLRAQGSREPVGDRRIVFDQ